MDVESIIAFMQERQNHGWKPNLPMSREKLMDLVMANQDSIIGNSDLIAANTSLIRDMAHNQEMNTDLSLLGEEERSRRLAAVRDKAMRAYVMPKLTQIDEALVENTAAVIPLTGEPIERYYWGSYRGMFVDPAPAQAAFEAGINDGVEKVLDLISAPPGLILYTRDLLEKGNLGFSRGPKGPIYIFDTILQGVRAEYEYPYSRKRPDISIVVSKLK